MRKENNKCFAVLYLPCSVIKPQQVLLSSHSHGYWKRKTRNVVYAQASGLILLCFNPKMPIETLVRVPLGIPNQTHLLSPNWRQPKPQQKQILYAKISFLYRQPRVMSCTQCCHQEPRDRGTFTSLCSHQLSILDLKAQDSCLPEQALGWVCHGSLGGFFIILFLPGCEMMKHWAVAGFWWVPLEMQLSCPVPSQVKWQCLVPGALWWMIWRTGKKRSMNIFRDVDHILANKGKHGSVCWSHPAHLLL